MSVWHENRFAGKHKCFHNILSHLFAYFNSTIHVGSKPDRYADTGTGFRPPGFAGNVGRIGRDAGFTAFHVTEDSDGIFCASLIWIEPVLTCFKSTSKLLKRHELKMSKQPLKKEKRHPHHSFSEGSTAWCPGRFLQDSSCCRQDCGGFGDVHWGSSVWRGRQCLYAGWLRFYWEGLHLCWTLVVEEDHLPHSPLRIPRLLVRHHFHHNQQGQQRGPPQQLWVSQVGQEDQGVPLHQEDPDKEKIIMTYIRKKVSTSNILELKLFFSRLFEPEKSKSNPESPVPRCLHQILDFQEHPLVQAVRCFLPFQGDPSLLVDPK